MLLRKWKCALQLDHLTVAAAAVGAGTSLASAGPLLGEVVYSVSISGLVLL